MSIKEYLSMFRWPNLVIITLSMIFMHWFVILPLLQINSAMNLLQFFLLLLAVLAITAAGYVINDFFDVDADFVNKPGKNLIGSRISEKKALNLFYLLSGLGIISGLILSWLVGEINFTLIFLFIAGILWYYSERYKCISLMGNVIVAVLSAISFGIVYQYDFFSLKNNSLLFSSAQSNFSIATKFVVTYIVFAFLSSFIREVIKDMEDYDGDKKVGCRTFSVINGISKAKIVTIIAGIFLLVFLVWTQIFFYRLGFYYLFGYFIIIDLFLLLILFKLRQAADIVDFANLSDLSKMFMLLGIISMILVRFEV